MTTKTLAQKIGIVGDVKRIAGGKDHKFIKLIAQEYGCEIVVKKNELTLKNCSEENFSKIEMIVNTLSELEKELDIDFGEQHVVETIRQVNDGEDPLAAKTNAIKPKETKAVFDANKADVLVFGNKGKIIRPKSQGHVDMIEASETNDIVFAIGPAGTGKTYNAVAIAVRALKNKTVKKIIFCRPSVEAGESLGFLPGNMQEKVDPYMRPIYDALDDMLPPDLLAAYMANRTIEIATLQHMRGRTLDAFMIMDEAQNATDEQLKMFMTRMGPSGKMIITGDMTQIDLPEKFLSGLGKSIRILKNIDGIKEVQLEATDNMRHRLIPAINAAYDLEAEHEEQEMQFRKKQLNHMHNNKKTIVQHPAANENEQTAAPTAKLANNG